MTHLKIKDFMKMFDSASNNLQNHSSRIDALNIFPVPDGDTGSNMSSTLKAANDQIKTNDLDGTTLNSFLKNFSKNLLMGARGNSGVILSQIFKGFTEGWSSSKDKSVSIQNLIKGFELASDKAYRSVLKPIEGTLLTVIRETNEAIKKLNISQISVEELFLKAKNEARKSCDNTPNLLPVLKQAGVVDSGGEGLYIIFEGFHAALIGKPIKVSEKQLKQDEFISESEIYDGEFGYCTEAIVELEEKEKFVKDTLTKKLKKLGDSMVVVNDEEILKVHVHTKFPGNILNTLQKYGEFIKIKSENMTIQANNTKQKVKSFDTENTSDEKLETGIISCHSGIGIIEHMKEFECSLIIETSQNSNPSIQDFIEAIETVNSNNLIILPNNKNIVLAAQQAAKLSKKNVVVIPTKTEIEAATAILNFSNNLSLKDNKDEIKSSLKSLIVGQISKSAKTTTINKVKVKKDDYLQILNSKIIGTETKILDAAKNLIDKMMNLKEDPEIIVIYYGIDISKPVADKLGAYVEQKYDSKIEVKHGDQYLYDFLISVE